MNDFILFGTDGCHLCEEAAAVLTEAGVRFDNKDIVDDEHAQQRYAIRIPVLLHSASGLELNWPFSVEHLHNFIAVIQPQAST